MNDPQDSKPVAPARNHEGKLVGGKGSLNPGGQPKWVKAARDAMRDELWPLAQRHLRWVLGGIEPADASEAEKAMYAETEVSDRTMAAKLVAEYALPKPKQSVKVSGSVEARPLSGLTPEQLLALASAKTEEGT